MTILKKKFFDSMKLSYGAKVFIEILGKIALNGLLCLVICALYIIANMAGIVFLHYLVSNSQIAIVLSIIWMFFIFYMVVPLSAMSVNPYELDDTTQTYYTEIK